MNSILIESARIKDTDEILMQYELTDSHRLASQKKDIVFECIVCNQILKVLRKNNTIFFSHKPNKSQNCYLTNQTNDEKELVKLNNEYRKTNKHLQYQKNIKKILILKKFQNIELEKAFYKNNKVVHRADVYFEWKDKKFVAEIQISPLSFLNIDKRVKFYKEQNIYLMWFIDFTYTSQSQFIKDIKYQDDKHEFFLIQNNHFLVHYKRLWYDKKENRLKEKWISEHFKNPKFDESTYKIFFYNKKEHRKELFKKYPKLYLKYNDFDDKNFSRILNQTNRTEKLDILQYLCNKNFDNEDNIISNLIKNNRFETLKTILSHSHELSFKLYYLRENFNYYFNKNINYNMRYKIFKLHFKNNDRIENIDHLIDTICAIKSLLDSHKNNGFINYINNYKRIIDISMYILTHRQTYSGFFIKSLKFTDNFDDLINKYEKFKQKVESMHRYNNIATGNSIIANIFYEISF